MKKIFVTFSAIALLLFPSVPTTANAEDMPTLNEEIIYDILVDRYNNGDQAPSEQVDVDDPYTYHGGDITGIQDQLDEIKEMGFTTISLSPIMENASKGYHGYWIEDFFEVEDEFGTMEDVQDLVEAAHDREMKVMLEFVPNYVATSNPIVDDPDKSSWFQSVAVDQTDATSWLEDVYAFDQTNEEVQQYLTDVALFWMEETNVDGFKLHAADESDPEFLESFVETLKEEDPYFYVIATSLQDEGDMSDLLAIEQIDAVANVPAFKQMNEVFIRPDEPMSILEDVRDGDEVDERDLLYVDNINSARFSNNFAEEGRNATTTWRLALSYLYFTPGVPIIYQGSEVPMYGPGYPENRFLVDFSSADPEIEEVFEELSKAREKFPALIHGEFEVAAINEGMSLFSRTYEGDTTYVAINNDSESRVVTIPGLGEDVQLRGLLQDDTIRQDENGELLIGMERESAEVFITRPNAGLNWAFISFVGGVFILFFGVIIFLTVKQRKREKGKVSKK